MCLTKLVAVTCIGSFVTLAAGYLGAQVNTSPDKNTRRENLKPQVGVAPANKAQGSSYSVNVSSVIVKSTPENKVVYQIAYSYEFKGRHAVYVKGLGTVPAKAKFSYFTFEPQLEFQESAAGSLIVSVPLEETTITMGAESTEFPKESDFPQAFRSDTWARPAAAFPEAAVRVIQKYFPSGYNARQGGQVNYYITTYRNLQVSDRNLRSQIAIIVSQPYDTSVDKFSYHVQFVARDRPRLSDTWRYADDRSQLTITVAQDLINQLISELTGAGGRQ